MINGDIKKGPFKPTFESLREYECPEWFKNAKLGIWSHWGPQSVPMYGDWYARAMYFEGTEQYRYHLRKYGHPSVFGYKDVVKLWKAENFDPDALMELYVAAGAKYMVAQAMHHDNFFNYASKLHNWNSVNIGPEKDIVGLWKQAAAKYNLPFGITEHMGATFSWYRTNKGRDSYGPFAGVPYDGNDTAYEELYLSNHEHYDASKAYSELEPWYTSNTSWHQHWFDVMKEVIDLYKPDLLYSDGALPFGEDMYEAGLKAVAHLYNTSIENNGGINKAVYNQKDLNEKVYSVGILDIERSQTPDIKPIPWQTDTCVGGWFYDVKTIYKKPHHVIELLIDIVSKNGNLLLNLPQLPDGTLDDECTFILREMAKWIKICGEGIYSTRPFRVYGEGPSEVIIQGFKEDEVNWTSSDFRFTQKQNILYAFQMRWPEDGRTVIKSLQPEEKVKSVRLLGSGTVSFEQPFGTLVIHLPNEKPTNYTNCFAIELDF